ncbi:carbohydrate-binding module family 52 protein [Glonium stellatum]|uniref:Carbohydrate-binding module family 52 protein n=1 Tax=Glonium stellatum TaxID=574774 RepID=A0A8E2JMK5_9PEZI|nr:carbohydrate-binding module family 52 protein [Glonium stellatum]
MAVLPSLLLFALLLASARADTCGSQQYDPSQYVCYYNQFLCPFVNGEGLSYCNGACYSQYMYQCTDNNTLALLPAVNCPFTMTISNPQAPSINGLVVNACGGGFSAGELSETCTYCPTQVAPYCPSGNETVLYSSGSMASEVPGGQQWYVDPSGALAFTAPHSAFIPSGSQIGGFAAYQNGGLVNLGSPFGFYACPHVSQSVVVYWDIFQQIAGVTVSSSCVGVNILVHPVEDAEYAWEYT